MSGGRKLRDVRDGLVVNLTACKYPLVREAAERLGYVLAEDESEMWDLCWSDLSVSSDRVQRLLPFQRLNHFPGMLEICRKAALSRHMTRMAARLPDDYRFYPTSLILPDQLDELMTALRRNKARAEAAAQAAASGAASGAGGPAAGGGVSTFILKPSAGTQGRGIALVQFPNQLAGAGDVGSCIAQAYVNSPLLLDGFKFDLRVYALVSSVDPLRIHLYDEGLARLATEPYKPPSPANLRSATMHLTNYAINKGAAGFVSADAAPPGGGHKRPMSAVLAQMAAQYGTTQEAILGSIADVVSKTVMAIQPLLAHTYHTSLSTAATAACTPACACPSLDHISGGAADPTAPCSCPPSLCFELLGFDIMFDTDLQPWLLEVNHSPSFTGDSRLDRAVKGEMLARAMSMLEQQPEARRTWVEAEARAQNERLYSSPYTAGVTTAGGSGGSAAAAFAAGRRAMSALPRSRQLQATAAALEEISANSAALLAAGGHVWGGGASGGSGSRPRPYSSGRPAGGGGADTNGSPQQRSRLQQLLGSEAGSTGSGASSGLRRSLSFSGGGVGSEASGGSGGGADLIGQRGFRLVFPAAGDADRKRYYRILQTAADLFPQQRCQCPWCSRRREISLLAMSGQQLGLAARPPSAGMSSGLHLQHHSPLTGHLPCRPGAFSAATRRVGSASARPRVFGVAGTGAGGGDDDPDDGSGSDADGAAPTYGMISRVYGTGVVARGGSRPSSSTSPGPRGKPPRPGGDGRGAASRTGGGGGGVGEMGQMGVASGSGGLPGTGGSWASHAHSSPSSSLSFPAKGGYPGQSPHSSAKQSLLAFPPSPTMASVMATNGYNNGFNSYNGYSSGAAGGLSGSSGGTSTSSTTVVSTTYTNTNNAAFGGSGSGSGGGMGAPRLVLPHRRSSANAALTTNRSLGASEASLPGETSGGSGAPLSSQTTQADAAAANPHNHHRGDQPSAALRPLSYSHSHPQARLGSTSHAHGTATTAARQPAGAAAGSPPNGLQGDVAAMRRASAQNALAALTAAGAAARAPGNPHAGQADDAAEGPSDKPGFRARASSSGRHRSRGGNGTSGGNSMAAGAGAGDAADAKQQEQQQPQQQVAGHSHQAPNGHSRGARDSVGRQRGGGGGGGALASPSRRSSGAHRGGGGSARAGGGHSRGGDAAAAAYRGTAAGSGDAARRAGGAGSSPDCGSDGAGSGSGMDGIRRSFSCTELEAALRNTAEALRATAAAAIAAATEGVASGAGSSCASAAAAAEAARRMPCSGPGAARASAGSGSTAAVAAAAVSAVVAGAPVPISQADLELLVSRARTASALSNRYVSIYMQNRRAVRTAR